VTAKVRRTHCGAFAADFAERVEEEEVDLEEEVEVLAVPVSSPVNIQHRSVVLSSISHQSEQRKSSHSPLLHFFPPICHTSVSLEWWLILFQMMCSQKKMYILMHRNWSVRPLMTNLPMQVGWTMLSMMLAMQLSELTHVLLAQTEKPIIKHICLQMIELYLGVMLYVHQLASRMCKHHLCWWVQLAIGMEESRLHWRSLGWVSYLLLLSKRTNNLSTT
jgi:hypothetical protein